MKAFGVDAEVQLLVSTRARAWKFLASEYLASMGVTQNSIQDIWDLPKRDKWLPHERIPDIIMSWPGDRS
jgi:hypothetical protein